jgi:hypothetical protein
MLGEADIGPTAQHVVTTCPTISLFAFRMCHVLKAEDPWCPMSAALLGHIAELSKPDSESPWRDPANCSNSVLAQLSRFVPNHPPP